MHLYYLGGTLKTMKRSMDAKIDNLVGKCLGVVNRAGSDNWQMQFFKYD